MTAPAALDPVDALDLSTDDTNVSEFVEHTIPSPEQVVAPTETTPEPPAPVDAAALPEGYKRDTLGRVHGPDGKIVAKDALAALTTPPAEAPAPEVVKPSPFQYRAFGETKPVDGFLQNADGTVTVTAEKVGELRYLLNAKDALAQDSEYVNKIKGENDTLRQDVERFKSGTTVEAQRANALVDSYTKMLQEPDEAKAVEAFFQLRSEYPVLLAKAEAQFYKNQTRPAGKPAPRGPVAPEAGPPSREDAQTATKEHVERIKLDFKYRDLTADDWKQIDERSARTAPAYIRPATPDDAKKYPVRVGQSVFDIDMLLADVESHASAVRAAREAAASAAKLAADNARRTTPSVNAPPSPGNAAAPTKTRKAPTNEKEWDEFMNSDELF